MLDVGALFSAWSLPLLPTCEALIKAILVSKLAAESYSETIQEFYFSWLLFSI